MNASLDDAVRTKISSTKDDPTTEKSSDSIGLSDDQILAVIREQHVCYDYCAAWKETTSDDMAVDAEVDT
jgi:hypothetical protein